MSLEDWLVSINFYIKFKEKVKWSASSEIMVEKADL